ncbi:NAD(P)-binding domain-containing protein [uncultured Chitinophaga sp.]|uniref:flavin-containing monooxygenase n=1 Tax=uncultured Chitinophaga sp. TaxID=339340 RepID=UPI0025E2D716|nr:NAD(P)-binding domain-containing protein [uncultured Chitinophaga sp.]
MQHIGIIGAGISGLATAKAFLSQGYRVTVFEKAVAIGGVWEKSRSYHGVTTQTTRDEYAYSDFPMPQDYPLWPSGEQVQAYLQAYATHFSVLPHIRFRTEVLSLDYNGHDWQLESRYLPSGREESFTFAFVAICTGTFHKAHIPDVPGLSSFRNSGGQVFHSSQISDTSILENKSVAVVGFAKSATDIATLAAKTGKDCTLLYRKAQWKVPTYFGNKINMRFLLFSRFSEAFFNSPYKTPFQRFLHSVGKPMVWAQWRGLEMLLKSQFKLKACGMVPKHRIEDQISCSLGVAPAGFYEMVHSGAIKAQQTEISNINGKEVRLQNGQTITPDVIVFGTGFRQSLPFLSEEHRRLIVGNDGAYRLFRNIMHPGLPGLGFVGYNSSLFTTLTSEIAANWLVAHVNGTLRLPSHDNMLRDINYMTSWRRQTRPVSAEFSGTCVAPFNFMHLDQLMQDMGLPAQLNRWSPLEFFKPINPKDYQQLLKGAAIHTRQPQPKPVEAYA